MTKVLSVLATAEPFRLASTDIFTLHSVKNGVKVDCYNALLKEYRKGKRKYDRLVSFIFNESLHRIIEVSNDVILGHERRRFKELLCFKYHRGRCSPPPYELENVFKEKSISSDPEWGVKELLRVSRLALENLQRPGKYDRTRLSMLTFDLTNAIGWFDRRATKREEGLADGQRREKGPDQGGV